jgi:hypothetical protein
MRKLDWTEVDKVRAAVFSPKLRINQEQEDQVKYLTYDFNDKERYPHRFKQVEIVHLTDLQIGSKQFLRSKFVKYRNWILAEPYRFGVLGGDVVNANTILSIGSPFDDNGEPIEEVYDAIEVLEPLSEKGRILGYVGGNHERRTKATFGDCGRLIARLLQIPYSGGIQLIDLHFGEHKPFTIALWHGVGKSQTKGAKAQILDRFMHKADAQLYLMGHLHDVVLLAGTRLVRETNPKGELELTPKKIMGVMSSSFMGYWNTYAEVAALDPTQTMMGRCILTPDGKWEVTLK